MTDKEFKEIKERDDRWWNGFGCSRAKRVHEDRHILVAEVKRLTEMISNAEEHPPSVCIYCGHFYEANAPDDVLKQHVEVCLKHPLVKARAEVMRLRDELCGFREPPGSGGA